MTEQEITTMVLALQRIAALDRHLPQTVPVSREQLESMANALSQAITIAKLTLASTNKK